MLLTILSLIDIVAGIFLLFKIFPGLAFWLGIIILLKGISSVVGSIFSKYFFDWMGFIDLIVGILLIFNLSVPWFWILPILKGSYTLILSFGD